MREELQDAFTGELQRELHDVMEDSNDRKYDEWVFTRKLDQALLPPPPSLPSPPLPPSPSPPSPPPSSPGTSQEIWLLGPCDPRNSTEVFLSSGPNAPGPEP